MNVGNFIWKSRELIDMKEARWTSCMLKTKIERDHSLKTGSRFEFFFFLRGWKEEWRKNDYKEGLCEIFSGSDQSVR